MKREIEVRNNFIKRALEENLYAICPFNGESKFIWDWQQDCFIDIEGKYPVEILNGLKHRLNFDIKNYIQQEVVQEGYIIKIETVFSHNNNVIGFVCEDGMVFNHRNWRDIDWEKCGF